MEYVNTEVVKVITVRECSVRNPIKLTILRVQFTVPLITVVIEGLSFSRSWIPNSFILFFAWSNLAAAVSDFVAACSMATDVPVTASV